MSQRKGEHLCLLVQMYVLSAERERERDREGRTAVFLITLIFQPSVGMWEMSASN